VRNDFFGVFDIERRRVAIFEKQVRQKEFQERRQARGVSVRAIPEIHESLARRWGSGGEAENGKKTPGVAGKLLENGSAPAW
jgi:hypothetical protein